MSVSKSDSRWLGGHRARMPLQVVILPAEIGFHSGVEFSSPTVALYLDTPPRMKNGYFQQSILTGLGIAPHRVPRVTPTSIQVSIAGAVTAHLPLATRQQPKSSGDEQRQT